MEWISIVTITQAVSELAFNGMMIVYLVQPYLEKDSDENIEVNQAVRIIAGDDNKLYLSTNEFVNVSQDVPPDFEQTNLECEESKAGTIKGTSIFNSILLRIDDTKSKRTMSNANESIK